MHYSEDGTPVCSSHFTFSRALESRPGLCLGLLRAASPGICMVIVLLHAGITHMVLSTTTPLKTAPKDSIPLHPFLSPVIFITAEQFIHVSMCVCKWCLYMICAHVQCHMCIILCIYTNVCNVLLYVQARGQAWTVFFWSSLCCFCVTVFTGSEGLHILLEWIARAPHFPYWASWLSHAVLLYACWVSNWCPQACGGSTSLTEPAPCPLFSILMIYS